ncbi:MAG: hypothetical protein ACI89J_001556 [Hyphomicrobiaceae bacterium]|jgi:hypothetical protein
MWMPCRKPPVDRQHHPNSSTVDDLLTGPHFRAKLLLPNGRDRNVMLVDVAKKQSLRQPSRILYGSAMALT